MCWLPVRCEGFLKGIFKESEDTIGQIVQTSHGSPGVYVVGKFFK